MGNVHVGAIEIHVAHGVGFHWQSGRGFTARVLLSGNVLVQHPCGWYTSHHDLTRTQLQNLRRQAHRIRRVREFADAEYRRKLVEKLGT